MPDRPEWANGPGKPQDVEMILAGRRNDVDATLRAMMRSELECSIDSIEDGNNTSTSPLGLREGDRRIALTCHRRLQTEND